MEKIAPPKISVVMPVYNAEKYLISSIDSILNQNFSNFELILVNDGSVDKSLEIIKSYEILDSRVVVINNSSNLGLVESLNIALSQSKGIYIARMDADDISLVDRFEHQVNYLDNNLKIFLVAGSFCFINENGVVIRKKEIEYKPKEVNIKILKSGIIHHPTVMFRNTGNIYYRKKMLHAEDRDLWLRLISEGKNLYVDSKIVLKYRIHENSMSTIYSTTQKKYIKKAIDFYNERLLTGKDSYDLLNDKDLAMKEGNASIKNQRRQIKLIFLSEMDSKSVIKVIKKYWSDNGFFDWIISWPLYMVCLLPKVISYSLRIKLKKRWE